MKPVEEGPGVRHGQCKVAASLFHSSGCQRCKGEGWSFMLSSHSIIKVRKSKLQSHLTSVFCDILEKRNEEWKEGGKSRWQGFQEKIISGQGSVHCCRHSFRLRDPPVGNFVRKKGRIFLRCQRLVAFQAEAIPSLSDALFGLNPVGLPPTSQLLNLLLNNWLLIIPWRVGKR